MDFRDLIAANGGSATRRQLMTVMSPKKLEVEVKAGALRRVRHGVYALGALDLVRRLAALDLVAEERIVACMGTAARLYGFDIEQDESLHILDPGVRMRPAPGLMVHQRLGAPLNVVDGRLATAPAWTAVEIARTLGRPRALATFDAALRVGACTRDELDITIREQRGRRGIFKCRELVVHADGRAESAMESEARLVFIDGGLPLPELQYEIVDLTGRLWRVDFLWPDGKLVVEYDSMEWHANSLAFKHDRLKTARLQDCGYTVRSITVDDVRKYPLDLVASIRNRLREAA